MQQLEQRNTFIPSDTSQVLSSMDVSLNKEETPSEHVLKTSSNNPDVNLPQNTGGLKGNFVFVISKEGHPLMPCTQAKAKKLIKGGKAKCIRNHPFTIKLEFECENKTQEITLGLDTGYKTVGFSCVTKKRELLSGELILDGKTSERLTERGMYRRGRRNRHHWYRAARFNNRKGRVLPPSVLRRYETHMGLIRKLKSLLPISKIIVETAKFDIQKIKNPEISGSEYQEGDLFEFQNIRSFLMSREEGKCQICSQDFKGKSSHVHHIIPRSKGGTDAVQNLAILHKSCHEKLHKRGLALKKNKQYKESTFMSIIHKRFLKDIPEVLIAYGYQTFVKRSELGLSKTHYNDAFVISGGTSQERAVPFVFKQKRRNNRSLQLNRLGFAPSIRRKRYSIRPLDLVKVGGKYYAAKGIHCKGLRCVVETLGSIKVSSIEKTYNFGGLQLLPQLKQGVSLQEKR